MKKTTIQVPEGIRYLSQWKGFMDVLPQGQHYILSKAICGCGATDFFIGSQEKIIIAAPRKHLLFDKYSQHPGNTHLYRFISKEQYFSNRKSSPADILAYNDNLISYLSGGGRTILTTYDSLGKMADILEGTLHEDLSGWIVVVDEFQAIYYDSVLKPQVEIDFRNALDRFSSVCYLSATPYLEKYLDMTLQFSSLPFIQLEWPAHLTRQPDIELIDIRNRTITDVCCELIEKYREGNGRTVSTRDGIFTSHEAVFYLNHVDLICKVIKKAGLKPSEVGIICSGKHENHKKLEKLSAALGHKYSILDEIPKRGDARPMFIFATSTAYIGCDFYSDNAYSYIFANPSVDSLSVDVSIDIQQICGRQRLNYPFSDSATLYYSTKAGEMTADDLEKSISNKNEETANTIANFIAAPHKTTQLDMIEKAVRKDNHKSNYICISRDASGNACVVKNDLLEIADRRSWDIKEAIFKNDWSMYRALCDVGSVSMAADSDREEIQRLFQEWIRDGNFSRKMRLYCDMHDDIPDILSQCSFVEKKYHDYHYALGREGLDALQWREDYIRRALEPEVNPFSQMPSSEIARRLIDRLHEGKDYTRGEVKTILKDIYTELGIHGKPSASDVFEYITVSEKSKRKGYAVTTVLHIVSSERQEVSLFKAITDVSHPYTYNIDAVLKMVAEGTQFDLARKTRNVRTETDKDRRDREKLKLPAVCFNGMFKGKNQNLLQKYSSYTALDFDHVNSKERMSELKDWLRGFSCVYAYFESPSGYGLKVIIQHDNYTPTFHGDLYAQLLEKFSCDELDEKPSDLARGNYLAYDPNIWKNPAPVSFHYVPSHTAWAESTKHHTQTVVKNGGHDVLSDDDEYTADFMAKLSQQVISDESILRILRSRWTGRALEDGRNNTAFSYLGILCKAGISRGVAEQFVSELIPDLPENEIRHAAEFAYSHNIFGCERRKYR